jgi:transcriptional regulator with XRE-family HTH domain
VRRETFGKIVAALRKERFDPIQGRAWTQKHLAQTANLSERLVANIERGDKVNLEGDILAGLADAFSLSTLERHEFYALAAEVTEEHAVNASHNPQQVREQVFTVIDNLRQPAFVYDDYFDIVAANSASLALHGIPVDWLLNMAARHGAANFMQVIFAPDSPMRRSMARNWEGLAGGNMAQFRAMSLRHRHTRRFRTLFTRLCALPDFLVFWSSTQQAQTDIASRMRVHNYPHPEYGRLFYSVFAVTSYSFDNHLHVTALMPLDDMTASVFSELHAQRPRHVLHLADWPQPDTEDHQVS